MDRFEIRLDSFYELEFSFTDSLRIYLPIDGSINVLVNSEIRTINKGEMLILNPYEAVLIYPDKNNLDNLLFKIDVSFNFLRSNKLDNVYYQNQIYNERVDNFLLSSVDELYELNKKGDLRTEKLLLAVLKKLSEDKYIRSNKNSFSPKEISLVDKYKERIYEDENFIDTGLKELSSFFNISTSYFSNIFKDVTGFTLSKFKQIVKIKKSADMLLSLDKTIDEISYIVGYQSPKSLYDIYKSNIGMLPSEYKLVYGDRKRYENLEDSPSYRNFKSYSKNLSYDDIYKKYPRYNTYKIENQEKIHDFTYKGIKIYDLSILGGDYFNNIKDINKNVGIKYLAIKVFIDKSNPQLIFLPDLNQYITKLELLHLIEMITIEKICLGIKIEILNKKIIEYSRDDFADIQDLQNYIIDNITDKYSKHFEWVIGLDKGYNKSFLSEYINKRISLLEFSLGKEAKISLSVGSLNIIELKDISRQLNEIDFSHKIKNIHVDLIYRQEFTLEYMTSGEVESYSYEKLVRKIEGCIENIPGPANIVVNEFIIDYRIDHRRELLKNLNKYKDLITATLYTGSLWHLKDNFIYYTCRDSKSLKKTHCDLVVEKDFKTSLSFGLYYLSEMDGQVIHMEPGMIVTKNEGDYHLAFYNNLPLDMKFASKKNFQNLDKFKRTIKFDMGTVTGKYKYIEKKINYCYGNINGILDNFDPRNVLLETEREYINSINYPHKKVKILDNREKIEIELEIEPFSLVFVDLLKI